MNRMRGKTADFDGKPIGRGLGSLFGFLFDAETRARVDKEWRQATEEAARESEASNKAALEKRKEGEPKCWVN
jgi:hypothetical protein